MKILYNKNDEKEMKALLGFELTTNSFQNQTWLLNMPPKCFGFNDYKQANVNTVIRSWQNYNISLWLVCAYHIFYITLIANTTNIFFFYCYYNLCYYYYLIYWFTAKGETKWKGNGVRYEQAYHGRQKSYTGETKIREKEMNLWTFKKLIIAGHSRDDAIIKINAW